MRSIFQRVREDLWGALRSERGSIAGSGTKGYAVESVHQLQENSAVSGVFLLRFRRRIRTREGTSEKKNAKHCSASARGSLGSIAIRAGQHSRVRDKRLCGRIRPPAPRKLRGKRSFFIKIQETDSNPGGHERKEKCEVASTPCRPARRKYERLLIYLF